MPAHSKSPMSLEHKKHLASGGKVGGCKMCMGGYDMGGPVAAAPMQVAPMASPMAARPAMPMRPARPGVRPMSEGGEVKEDEREDDEEDSAPMWKNIRKYHPKELAKGMREADEESDPQEYGNYDQGGEVGPTLGSIIGYPGSDKTAPVKKAEGGEIDDLNSDDAPELGEDEEIHGMLGKELLHALESKDHKQIMDCIEACVLSCMNKGSE